MAADARVEHWISGLRWWFPIEDDYFIKKNDVRMFNPPIKALSLRQVGYPMTFDIVLGDPDPEDDNRYFRVLSNQLRPPLAPMLNADGKELHPWGATVVGDSLTIYRRIGDNPLSIFARYSEGMPKIAANDSPMAEILTLIKNDFEDLSDRDGHREAKTPSTLSEEEPDDESSNNNGANRDSRRETERRHPPATERDLGYSSSHICFNTWTSLGGPGSPMVPYYQAERLSREARDRASNDRMRERRYWG
ncbi:hypothetical protein AbraIFM66951_005459 [Aspergillus brasiliensis]|nr:hypothetical protein AbraIFM66951_005459 [Aspergillus brasiliensis]